ncbi:MAG: hypothetical protein DRN81_04965 [Thermoproteota archaeon]|nr:MAG: hypothetical protein DRN81_04965 [Candidatus Korarchaeota archaeon]
MLKISRDTVLKYNGKEHLAKSDTEVDLAKVFKLKGIELQNTELRLSEKLEGVEIVRDTVDKKEGQSELAVKQVKKPVKKSIKKKTVTTDDISGSGTVIGG